MLLNSISKATSRKFKPFNASTIWLFNSFADFFLFWERSIDIFNAIEDPVNEIVNTIRSVLEVTPPELIGDIYTNGIVLTGGGALLTGLDKYITSKTGVKCYAADDPISCVARGTGFAFKLLDQLLDGFESIPLYKY